jgi:hypothetical protein
VNVEKPKRYRRLVWGGFVNGTLHVTEIDTGFGGYGRTIDKALAIFRSRARAERAYEDVRRIEISEVE